MTEVIRYYVDESGDLTLFNKKGTPVHNESSPSHLMIGLLKIKDSEFLSKFNSFRDKILIDPIFCTFPSYKKTSINFHAKDDHIAIKREVFNFIKDLDISVQVVIRQKPILIDQAISQYKNFNSKLTPRQIYNDMVTRLFKGKLHKAENYEVFFSNRGNTTENLSLIEALNKACENFYSSFGIKTNSTYKVICRQPSEEAGLQIIDYCLWALQRVYEKSEIVYFKIIEDKFKLIIDVDDKQNNAYGEYYSVKNKMSLEKIKRVS